MCKLISRLLLLFLACISLSHASTPENDYVYPWMHIKLIPTMQQASLELNTSIDDSLLDYSDFNTGVDIMLRLNNHHQNVLLLNFAVKEKFYMGHYLNNPQPTKDKSLVHATNYDAGLYYRILLSKSILGFGFTYRNHALAENINEIQNLVSPFAVYRASHGVFSLEWLFKKMELGANFYLPFGENSYKMPIDANTTSTSDLAYSLMKGVDASIGYRFRFLGYINAIALEGFYFTGDYAHKSYGLGLSYSYQSSKNVQTTIKTKFDFVGKKLVSSSEFSFIFAIGGSKYQEHLLLDKMLRKMSYADSIPRYSYSATIDAVLKAFEIDLADAKNSENIEKVKDIYRDAARLLHPDKLRQTGATPQEREQANAKIRALNEARNIALAYLTNSQDLQNLINSRNYIAKSVPTIIYPELIQAARKTTHTPVQPTTTSNMDELD